MAEGGRFWRLRGVGGGREGGGTEGVEQVSSQRPDFRVFVKLQQ